MIERFYRRLSPKPRRQYRDYRGHLRYEFRFRCCYCGTHEDELLMEHAFEIDHFRPKAVFPDQTNDYSNLYFACRECNLRKRHTWPTESDEVLGLRFVDPCRESMLGKHARMAEDGTLIAETSVGRFTIEHLQLNRRSLVRLRKRRLEFKESHYVEMSRIMQSLKEINLVLADPDFPDEQRARIEFMKDDFERLRSERLSMLRRIKLPCDE